jgi:hypothetical protein
LAGFAVTAEVVSDSSCLIDLQEVALLDAFLRLPYEVLIPNTLFEDELISFSVAQKRALIRAGLKVIDLPGERVLRAHSSNHGRCASVFTARGE